MKQKPQDNKPLHEAQIDYFNWVNANIFGKVRQIKDAFEYSVAFTGVDGFHPEADAVKNVSTSDLAIAMTFDNSTTNMLVGFDKIQAGQFNMLGSHKEWKLGTLNSTNTVADVGNPVTAQTITLSDLTALNYYAIFIPTNKASKFEMTNAAIINNTVIGTTGGLPAGYHGIIFKMNSGQTGTVITLTAALGVGLATGTNTQLKLYPVLAWSTNELKLWNCSDL